MESAEGDLSKMTRNLESHELAKIRFTPELTATLDELLSDIYIKQRPKPIDYQNRLNLVRIFNIIAREIYGHSNRSPIVEGYGSFVMDMFNEKSDLDMSINFVGSAAIDRKKKILTLRKFVRKLYTIQNKGHITSVELVATARIPIIKLTDRGTGIECDLSVENRDGIAKSRIIHAISAIDERFRMLCFLMKSWAQAHNINSSRDRTLNSLSIVSLVAFHLQTCSPPILPPFSALLGEGADPASVINVVRRYLNYGKNNKDSLAKLFITLFVKIASVEHLWKNGLCVSLFKGSWISKSWGRSYSISIEDFTDPSQNVARAVQAAEFGTIYACIRASLHQFIEFLNGKMQGKDLLGLLFGAAVHSTQGARGTSKTNHNMNNHPTLLDPLPSKKRHLEEEGLAQSQAKKQAWQGVKPHGMGGMQHSIGTTVLNDIRTPSAPLTSHQPPLPIPRISIGGHHYAYAPRPSLPPLEAPYHPPIQPQLTAPQTFHGYDKLPWQGANAVAVTRNGAIHPHLPPASRDPHRGEHALYNHRRY